jgi:hypothetical protein
MPQHDRILLLTQLRLDHRGIAHRRIICPCNRWQPLPMRIPIRRTIGPLLLPRVPSCGSFPPILYSTLFSFSLILSTFIFTIPLTQASPAPRAVVMIQDGRVICLRRSKEETAVVIVINFCHWPANFRKQRQCHHPTSHFPDVVCGMTMDKGFDEIP